MATTQKVKLANGTIITQEIDPSFGAEFTVPTDDTELNIKVIGPDASTTVETIGGRNRRP
jgi:hypothetical protein